MKIVQVCPRYHPYIGGVEKYVRQVSEGLIKRGFDVEVFSTDPSGILPAKEIINGVRVKRFKSFAPSEVGFFSTSLLNALRKAECDIVHAHGYRAFPMLLAALAKRDNKAKLVVTPHLGFSKVGKLIYSIYNPLFGRLIFSRADRIVTVSPAEIEEVPLLRWYMDKIVLIPIGIDVSKIKNPNRGEDSDVLNLIYVGRMEKKKGLDKLVEVMNMLRGMPIRLRVVGEGPYLPKILPLIHKMQNIEFRGRVSEQELHRLYASSQVFILLSKFESHSVSLTEAMAFGVVPIVTNVGGNRYVVDDETGFLVDYPVKVDEVARLLKMLYMNREILREKSVAARERVLARFNIEDTLARLMRLYLEVLSSN